MVRLKWRYTYGRQITPSRLGRLQVTPDNEFKPSFSYIELKKKLAQSLIH